MKRTPREVWVWRRSDVVGLFILLGVAVAATWDAWSDIYEIATRDEEQSHVLLVPIVAAWLVWVRRMRLRHCPRKGRMIGPAVVAVGWFLYSFGDLRLIQAFWHLGAVVVVIGCFLAFAGHEYLLRLLPAFVVLGFLVPVPGAIRQEIAIPLQTATASATHYVLGILGVETELAGSVLRINGVEVAIAEACNGLRMVFALVLVSYTFAYGSPLREPVRWLIVLASPVSAILCNVIRLVPTVWVYGEFSTAAGDRFHDLSGWVMLPIAFLLLLGILRALRWALVPVYRFTLAYGR